MSKDNQDAVKREDENVDPLEATKRMNGVSGPNPVTERYAPTHSDDDDAANAGVKEQNNGK